MQHNILLGRPAMLAMVTAGLCAVPSAAQTVAAAPPPQAAADTPGEIIVTAQKRSESLSKVPMSITALSGDTLRARGVQGVQDLVKFTPGLSYVDSGASTPVYSLRGVGFFDTTIGARPTVSVYVDEVPQPFSIMTQGAGLDLERVEVLKGPQGTLFGQNATGGAINYIAAKPTPQFKTGLDLSFSRFNTLDATGFVGGPVSDTLGVRVSGRVLRGDDWQESDTRDDSLGRKNFVQGRVILDWKPSNAVRFTLNANGFRDKSDTQAAQFVAFVPSGARFASLVPGLASYPVSPGDDRSADWDPNTPLRRDNSFYQVSLRGDVELSDDLTLTSITAYSRFHIDQLTDQDGTALTNALNHQGGYDDSLSQEVRLASKGHPFRWLIGASYSRDHAIEHNLVELPYSTSNYAPSPFGQLQATVQDYHQRFTTPAVFANVDWDFARTLTFHGGLRYTDARLAYSGCSEAATAAGGAALTGLFNALRARQGLAPIGTIPVGGCIMVDPTLTPARAQGHFNEDNVSFRTGVDWKPTSRLMVYGNISRGYKAGSTPSLNGTSTAQVVPARQESVIAYEVGTKFALPGGFADLAAAGFYYDYTDKQVRGRTLVEPALLGALETLVNIPKSRVIGAEVQLNLRPLRRLALSLSGSYLDSKVTSDFLNYSLLGVQRNFKGNVFPYTPKYQLTADGQYIWALSSALDAFVGGNVSYRSKTNSGFGDEAVLDIKAYTLVDLRAGVESHDGRWRVQLFGRNVTNAYYWTNVARQIDNVRRYAGMPATYGVQLTWRP